MGTEDTNVARTLEIGVTNGSDLFAIHNEVTILKSRTTNVLP